MTSKSHEGGKVAVVTGGSRGIGRGIVLELAKAGLKLVIHSRTGGFQANEAMRLAIEAGSPDVLCLEANVAELGDCRRLVEQVYAHFGRCDIWVNNAGIAPEVRLDLLDTTAESWDKVVSTNLRGPFFLTQIVANRMLAEPGRESGEQRKQRIVFVTSISSVMASVTRGEYCVSKAGLSMVAELFAARLAEAGIVVTEIQPGIIETDMTSAVKEKYDKLIAEGLVPQKRWGRPEDIGRIVARIAAGDYDFSTGAVIRVDGGLTIPRL